MNFQNKVVKDVCNFNFTYCISLNSSVIKSYVGYSSYLSVEPAQLLMSPSAQMALSSIHHTVDGENRVTPRRVELLNNYKQSGYLTLVWCLAFL